MTYLDIVMDGKIKADRDEVFVTVSQAKRARKIPLEQEGSDVE